MNYKDGHHDGEFIFVLSYIILELSLGLLCRALNTKKLVLMF
jgi:hypothetical protein